MDKNIGRNKKTKLEDPNQPVFSEIFEAGDVPIPDQSITVGTARRLGILDSESDRLASKQLGFE